MAAGDASIQDLGGHRPSLSISLGLAAASMNTCDVSTLLETLAAELERPRELSARILNYIGGTYGVDHDVIGAFLVDELPKLEDYEIDLILSPVFTPKLADQSVFAELLGAGGIPRPQWPALIQQLISRPVRAQLVTNDGQRHSVILREVTVERYVHRLRLDATIPASLFKLLDETPPAPDRALLKAVARCAVWENETRRNILARYLSASLDRGSYSLPDALELLNVVENQKPADVDDLLSRIPRRLDALRDQINIASGPKPFFDAGVQAVHGGVRDQRGQAVVHTSAKENEFAFLDRLRQILA